MADNAVVTGVDQILRKMTALEKKGSGRVLAAMIRGQLSVIGKQMKSDVNSKVKEGRKGIRSRFKNNAKNNWIQAKVGFGVGKKSKKPSKVVNRKGNRKAGVGISAQNIHWWVAGTDPRFTGGKITGRGKYKRRRLNGKPVHPTGRMPSMQPQLARIAAAKSKGKQNAEMIRRGALQLQKEIIQLKAIR